MNAERRQQIDKQADFSYSDMKAHVPSPAIDTLLEMS